MYCVTVLFEVRPDRYEAFRSRVVRQANDSIEQESGCHRFDVWTDPARSQQVYLYEIYEDRAAFDAHLQSKHFKAFDQEVADWVTDKQVVLWGEKR